MISKGEITFIPPCCLYTVCFVALHSQLWHVRVCVAVWGQYQMHNSTMPRINEAALQVSQCLRMISPGNELADIHPTLPGALGEGASWHHPRRAQHTIPSCAACTSTGWEQQQQQPGQICSRSKPPLPSAPLRVSRASPKGQAGWGLEHPDLAEGVPVHGRGLQLRNL